MWRRGKDVHIRFWGKERGGGLSAEGRDSGEGDLPLGHCEEESQ